MEVSGFRGRSIAFNIVASVTAPPSQQIDAQLLLSREPIGSNNPSCISTSLTG
jgi:hypothetical protein